MNLPPGSSKVIREGRDRSLCRMAPVHPAQTPGPASRPGGTVREQLFVPPLAVLPLGAGQRRRAGRGFLVVQIVRLHTQNIGQCLVGGALLRVSFAFFIGIPPPKTPRSMQPHGTGRCIMDQARRCCSSQTIRVGFSALMRRARTVNTRMVSSVKTTSHTAR